MTAVGPEVSADIVMGDVVFFNNAEAGDMIVPDGTISVLREISIVARLSHEQAKKHNVPL